MPWTKKRSGFADDIGPLQTVLNIVFIVMIVLFFLIIQAYRTSLDTMKAEIGGLKGEASATVQGDGGDGVGSANDALLGDVSDLRDRIAALDERVEMLAAKSVDVRSMEGLRDEMLVARERLTALESGMEAVDVSAPDGGDAASGGASEEDIETALTEAQAARDELRQFKTLLGYGDM